MPTYSYRCTECDTAFDIQQAFTDASLTQCPTCTGKLRKVFSAIGVSFNGSGFYRNDSREKTGGRAKSDSTSESKSDSTSGSKAESKAAASSSDSSSSSSSGTSDAKPASTEKKKAATSAASS